MSAKKNAPPRNDFRLLRMLVWDGNVRRALAVGLVVLVVLWFAGRASWLYVRRHVTARDEYRLTVDDFHLTPPPAWIRTEVRTEAVRATGLDRGASILDDDLAVRVAEGFKLHPWIARVDRVTKSHPARVDVEVTYRQPTVMVEVPEGLYPADAAGIWLPTADFLKDPLDAQRNYPRLGGITTEPQGPVGTYWGDPRVRGGAKIGAQLIDRWVAWDLERITPVGENFSSDGSGQLYEIRTRDGAVIQWGHAPEAEADGEGKAADKVARIGEFMQARQASGGAAGPHELDLRHAGATPHTANRTPARDAR
ncbi:MAG: hypothetical protein KF708_05060 [Pirellulales bacterium]|nr:hypothetical protein [Pirellulales bacterium]